MELSSSHESSPHKDQSDTSFSAVAKMSDNSQVIDDSSSTTNSVRNLVAFWLLGLCNNFAYVIMLSAANDILKDQDNTTDSGNQTSNSTNDVILPGNLTYLECNPIGTGLQAVCSAMFAGFSHFVHPLIQAILLADILPTFFIKITAPVYLHRMSYRLKVSIVVLFSTASFLLVSFSVSVPMSLFGVVCASVSGGLGEITLLSYASFYHKNVVSTWSSGTGGAGIFGALSYAGLTSAGMSPRNTLLVMLIIPVIMVVCFFFVLTKPPMPGAQQDVQSLLSDNKKSTILSISLKQRLLLIVPLLKYMIPLTVVYYGEYFINQGLHELLYFNSIWLTKDEQYRWFQVDYQLGVFLSRSSVNLFRIKHLWILPILQILNVALLVCQVYFQFIPNIWIIFTIILYEGLLGGLAYVNTFYTIAIEVEDDYREYSMGVATIGDSVGIVIAGITTVPVHNLICSRRIMMRA